MIFFMIEKILIFLILIINQINFFDDRKGVWNRKKFGIEVLFYFK